MDTDWHAETHSDKDSVYTGDPKHTRTQWHKRMGTRHILQYKTRKVC